MRNYIQLVDETSDTLKVYYQGVSFHDMINNLNDLINQGVYPTIRFITESGFVTDLDWGFFTQHGNYNHTPF